MKIIELITMNGEKFLFDLESGWQIFDYGHAPAIWSNYKNGANLDCKNTYKEIKSKLLPPAEKWEGGPR